MAKKIDESESLLIMILFLALQINTWLPIPYWLIEKRTNVFHKQVVICLNIFSFLLHTFELVTFEKAVYMWHH